MSKYYRNAYSLLLRDLNGENGPIANSSATCMRMCPIGECEKRIASTHGTECECGGDLHVDTPSPSKAT